ncbi:MAG: hypothetical protein HKN63_02225 [Rhodobacteraceae bacterium]|nr:hypothetical protein [Paracoccaceae bacterium]
MHILRMAFLLPAIADFGLAASTIFEMLGILDDSLVPRGQFAGVALSWGVLLLVGLSNPVERAWVLGPTAFVIGCIAAGFLLGFYTGLLSIARLVVACPHGRLLGSK